MDEGLNVPRLSGRVLSERSRGEKRRTNMKRIHTKTGVMMLLVSFTFFSGLGYSSAEKSGFPTKSIELVVAMALGAGT